MAKITHKGSWIQISSLNKEDKKNYLTSITLFFVGALFWGIHLTSVDGIFGPKLEEDVTNTTFLSCGESFGHCLMGGCSFLSK